jgi:ABC-type transport system involved in cytochrome bd biosynthesis fused ATPase/permease subunit
MEIEPSYNKPTTTLGNEVVATNLPTLSPLSETLWREKTKTEFIGDVSARLTWKDLTVMVTLSNGETQNVLENLTGYAEPGYFTALMGPSGSGKSTLLDALSSRLASNAFQSGTVLLNGRKEKLSFGTAVSIYTILFLFLNSDLCSFILFYHIYMYMCLFFGSKSRVTLNLYFFLSSFFLLDYV